LLLVSAALAPSLLLVDRSDDGDWELDSPLERRRRLSWGRPDSPVEAEEESGASSSRSIVQFAKMFL
jgi:hypothetical protein